MGDETQLRIVMLPWLAQGHINPFINLSKALASHWDVKVSIVSTPVNISRIRSHLQEEPIHLLELQSPSVDGLTPGVECTSDIKPESAHLLHRAFDQLDKPFGVRHRRAMGCDGGLPPGHTELCVLRLQSSGIRLFCRPLQGSRESQGHEGGRFDPTSDGLSAAYHLVETVMGNFIAFADRVWACCQQSCGIVIKSCFEEEDKYLKYRSHITGKPVISVGPLVIAGGATEDKSGNYVYQTPGLHGALSERGRSTIV
ncbi:hypothetical protein SUGI_0653430 [Cryptomeria japonica]|uniref:UDP-glucosyltransferase 29-like n=1 Tax=Cryptomeria japonica TaxID=3369 RepID=UPI002414CCE1|nr:UDP-glucosyltransferase 29-like [Cryptomeria japonica]GLJ32482.1 hypothetical protein SUGI_0653430 [Cryptomeria japonica]